MTRPWWLRRVVMNRHRPAIEQASRRWRGGRRDDQHERAVKCEFHTDPDYKGPWEHPLIPNKDYAPETYAKYKDLTTVGFELWTVNGGSIFDNILVTDDKKYADKMAEKTWKKIKGEEGSGEKEAKEAWKKENEPEEEPEEDDDDDDEDDDEEEEHDEL